MALLGILLGITMVAVLAFGVVLWLNIVVVGKIASDADELAARVKLLEDKPKTIPMDAKAEQAATGKAFKMRTWNENIGAVETK